MIANNELGCTEISLRHALHLVQLAPRESRPREYEAIDEAAYEALLEAGKLDEAAERLSCGTNANRRCFVNLGGVETTIRCATLDRTTIGKEDSVAAATLQA